MFMRKNNMFMQMMCLGLVILVADTLVVPSVLSRYEHEENISLSSNHSIYKNIHSLDSSNSQYYAVIAACSQYQNPKYNLPKAIVPPFSNEKLTVFYHALLQSKNWNSSNIILLVNQNATKQNITAAFEQMTTIVGPNDYFLFSWCGHGSEVPDINGDERLFDPNDTKDEVICPYDTAVDNHVLFNGITDDELGNLFSNITCKGMTLIFDCCLSGGMVDETALNSTVQYSISSAATKSFSDGLQKEIQESHKADVNGNNRVVLMSTQPDYIERAVFLTGFPLITGLAFACTHPLVTDKNKDGSISAEEVFRIAKPLVFLQSSVYWAGFFLLYYFLLTISGTSHAFLQAILETNSGYQLAQRLIFLRSHHHFKNFPTIQDDYPGELPLFQL
jgi:hypothetical protein